jgi:hypothetical protein
MVIPDLLDEGLLYNYNILLIILFFVMTIVFYRIQIITHTGFFKFKKKKKDKSLKSLIKTINKKEYKIN